MGLSFPGADTPESFWDLVSNGRCMARRIESSRWPVDPARLYESGGIRQDSVYSLSACLINDDWMPNSEGISLPKDVVTGTLDPIFGLAIHAAAAAWRSARTNSLNRDKVSVILGNIALPTESTAAWSQELFSKEMARRQEVDRPLSHQNSWNRDPVALPARLISKSLALGGRSFTLDAACASSLYALRLAMDELRSGRADAVLAGGLSRPDCLYTQMGFAQLHALSSGGVPRPFDHRGDGLVVGEGAGIFLLKRLGDALNQGDRILGVLRAVGLSNDVSGALLAPSSEGQLRAMRAAYEESGLSPDQIDTIECHATGTPVGDTEEFKSLKTLWADSSPKPAGCVLGSVKSNIGHGLTSAGAAGLAKLLLAFEHETIPPTANYEKPRQSLDLAESPFRILSQSEHWPRRDSHTPRRAALSGFGFGGINAHLIVEEYLGQSHEPPSHSSPTQPAARTMAITGLGGRIGAHQGVNALTSALVHGQIDPPVVPDHWYGVGDPSAFPDPGGINPAVSGWIAETVDVPIGRFRIPPSELEEILPQQAMILNAAHEAAQQAGWIGGSSEMRLRTAVLLGVSLDQGTNHFQLRWTLTDPHATDLRPTLDLKQARDTLGPPLTANRVMGNLASIAASRLAREFRLGGPSFTISEGPDAGLTALEVACGWIESGLVDEALVGAVDLTSDLRHAWAEWLASRDAHGFAGRMVMCDAALAVILKRADEPQLSVPLAYLSLEENRSLATIVPTFHQLSAQEPIYAGAATSFLEWTRHLLGLVRKIEPVEGVILGDGAEGCAKPSRFWMAENSSEPRQAILPATRPNQFHRLSENLDSANTHYESLETSDPVGLFLLDGQNRADLIVQVQSLSLWLRAPEQAGLSPARLAARWWHSFERPESVNAERLSMVLWRSEDGPDLLAQAIGHIQSGKAHGPSRVLSQSDTIYEPATAVSGDMAFVFPGMGNAYAGMGRELSARWPSLFDTTCQSWSTPRAELLPGLFWDRDVPTHADDHSDLIFGQAALGTAVSDFVRSFGIEPHAMLGLSLGESVLLLASGTWADHDGLWRRMRESPLFQSELAGECRAARRYWNLSPDQPVDWLTVVVPKPIAMVQEAIASEPRVSILIINAPGEVVLGGQAPAISRVLEKIKCRKLPVGIVSTMHAPLALSVRDEYFRLHTLPINDPAPLRLYSAVFGGAYVPTPESAAEAITGLSHQTVDFVRLIEQAYTDGVRSFVEIGPGNSCARMIQSILKGRPYRTIALTPPKGQPIASFLRGIAELFAIGHGQTRADWTKLFGAQEIKPAARVVSLRVGGPPIDWPTDMSLPSPQIRHLQWQEIPEPQPTPPEPPQTHSQPPETDPESDDNQPAKAFDTKPTQIHLIRPDSPTWSEIGTNLSISEEPEPMTHNPQFDQSETPAPTAHQNALAMALMQTQEATTLAHLEFQNLWSEMMEDWRSIAIGGSSSTASFIHDSISDSIHHTQARPEFVMPTFVPDDVPRSLSRELCLTYGRGPIAPVFGKKFAEVDNYPTRVRLPDEPLMLVDRVTLLEGEPLSMTHGRIVTEHDIFPDDWYLDCNRIPVCIAVESGQADLMLSGYLGIDFITKGLAMYRLLDAVVTFHDHLPQPGDVIVYDIKILSFFRQDATYLFRFAFDATVNGRPILTMRDGCAGFFTPEHLAAGQGIVRTTNELRKQPGKLPADWRQLVPMVNQTVSVEALDALRQGDFVTAFGPAFANIPLRKPVTLPSGRMRLVDRVTELDPTGGRFGLGLIRAEFDIDPDAWFMTCHFIDDRVMPGTLMYECCLHTLRIFLLRMGWICEETPEVALEPIPEVRSRLRCRGQVLESTKKVTYEIEIKELGYGPEPYCIADALMYADGKPVVDMRDMSLKYTGVTRHMVEQLWSNHGTTVAPASSDSALIPFAGGYYPRESAQGQSTPAKYTHAQILDFAEGEPWRCFGEPYKIFDGINRKLARLPRPPFNFLHRVTNVTGKPFEMVAGGTAVGEYDVHADDWYFAQERTGRIPFTVLQEAALQVCGWLSSYVGSALTSETDLAYRNLGGSCKWHRPMLAESKTLTTKVKLTQLSQSAGMVIQHFHMDMFDSTGPVYSGTTYFGFFDKESLKNQVGIRGFQPWEPSTSDLRQSLPVMPYPTQAPLPDSTLQMIDKIVTWLPNGGPNGLGYVVGETPVKPGTWFFDAHFYQDPVVPGSLGLESFIQLMKAEAVRRWGHTGQFKSVGIPAGTDHEWIYRGQVVPTDRLMTTKMYVTKVDDTYRTLWADGHLEVDGRYIYQMKKFAVQLI